MSKKYLTCRTVVRHLHEYLDHELDHTTSTNIDRHLETCRDCFSRVEFEKRLRAKVHESLEQKTPDRLYRRIKDIVEGH